MELPALRVVDTVAAMPGTGDGSGILVDLAWLSTHQIRQGRGTPAPTEWWLATADSGGAAEAVEELSWVAGVRDRRALAGELLADPLGTGVLIGLWAAAAAAVLLAGFGLLVDSRATAVRRRGELAVLHTVGTGPRVLARSLMVEQAVLAGLGVAAGLLAGLGVAVVMGPSLVLTAAGGVPVPVPVWSGSPVLFGGLAAGLFGVAVVQGGLVARRARREVAAGPLRIGED